ncbi:hypothetical protein DNTS_032566 [Danionella cerebrum]|uniref:TRAM domain-containing protein n=1 Tax=Danionella cerebrum TaxID=2873325 RepID=A0A553PY79_9TELE|nr:hypothetical protein DNTS_032566 [Danionella translucida]
MKSCNLCTFKLLRFSLRNCLSQCLYRDTSPRYYSNEPDPNRVLQLKSKLQIGPSFHDFIKNPDNVHHIDEEEHEEHYIPNLKTTLSRKVYFETYGCQMNVSDTEIAWTILQNAGYSRTQDLLEADVILLVTCSIREKAEQTIWNRLKHLSALKRKTPTHKTPLKLGVLGCMAERLKTELLEREKMVDVVAGPDAYRDLPRLLSLAHSGQKASNVLLSLEETYADVIPVHRSAEGHSAFVSIMRGCDNMCSYCIVPFTRGKERSRPGVKQVTLLGQNVNSYRDISEEQFRCSESSTQLSKGFKTVYRAKKGGLRFTDLLDRVSLVNPEMRIRFTSPHPKDFPNEVKTQAYHRLQDDIPVSVKSRRLKELFTVYREEAEKVNLTLVGCKQLVLVEGDSKRSSEELSGRNDGNIKVIFPKKNVPVRPEGNQMVPIKPGDYVLVEITSANSQSLRGLALHHSSVNEQNT